MWTQILTHPSTEVFLSSLTPHSGTVQRTAMLRELFDPAPVLRLTVRFIALSGPPN